MLPAGHQRAEVQQTPAARDGLHARAVEYYALGLKPPNGLHLGFAALPEQHIEAAAEAPAAIIRSLRSGP